MKLRCERRRQISAVHFLTLNTSPRQPRRIAPADEEFVFRPPPSCPAPRVFSPTPPPLASLAHEWTRPASAVLRPHLFAPRSRLKVRSRRSLSTLTRPRSAHPATTGLRAAPAILDFKLFPEEGRFAPVRELNEPPLLQKDFLGG